MILLFECLKIENHYAFWLISFFAAIIIGYGFGFIYKFIDKMAIQKLLCRIETSERHWL